jgi:methyl coenzyme M reductase alpha subunit
MTKPTLSLVADLPVGNLADIPALLRKLADDIEAGSLGTVHAAAVVLEAPGLPVYGFGATGYSQNASELHSMAHLKLTAQRLNYIESLEP